MGKGDIFLILLGGIVVYVVAFVALATAAETRGPQFLKNFRRYLVWALGTLPVAFLGSMTIYGSTQHLAAGYAAGGSILLLFVHMAIAAAFSRIEGQA